MWSESWGTSYLQAPLDSVTRFCQAISQNPPKSSSICIVPRGLWFETHHSNTYTPRYYEVGNILKPLRMLRNIDSVSIVPAEKNEYVLYNEPDAGEIQPHHISLDFVKELTLLTQGSTPVKHLFLMNKRLISYAQKFERNHLFKSMMRSSQVKALCQLRDARLTHYFYFANPHRANFYHPVENALDYSGAAAELDSLLYFLEARKTVLEYLEPQYRRLTESALQMVEYVKEHKAAGGLQPFGHQSKAWGSWTECTRGIEGVPSYLYSTGMVLVEEYAKSFERVMLHGQHKLTSEESSTITTSLIPRCRENFFYTNWVRLFIAKAAGYRSINSCSSLDLSSMTWTSNSSRSARLGRSFWTWTLKISDMISVWNCGDATR